MGIAGMGYTPCLSKIRRIIGIFLHYWDYFKDFSQNRFSKPPIFDPTEKSQFSNLVGKAIADYLSKQINGSRFTIAYEHAMRESNLPIQGSRPDLIAFISRNLKFAIEAKGFSNPSVSNREMNKHKLQAQSGPINVNFSVASITYNLYNSITCKYYDPPAKHNFGEGDRGLLRKLSQRYYSGFKGLVDKNLFEITEEKYRGEDFYVLTPYKGLMFWSYSKYKRR